MIPPGTHCTCCYGAQEMIGKMKLEVEGLKVKVEQEQKRSDDFRTEASEAVDACEIAEKERDERTDDRDEAVDQLHLVRVGMLEFLRKIEFDPIGVCPFCAFDWELAGFKKRTHVVGCELKLKIFQLDMEISKPGYAMSVKNV